MLTTTIGLLSVNSFFRRPVTIEPSDMEEEEIVRKEEVTEESREKEVVRDQLMNMETRVGMVEQQMTACQKRLSCNGQILGELLHILPPLLPVASLEEFAQFSSNLTF